ncbi:hypothetical protein QBC46DRAFT_426028 [Diplogelasinospora grovesii]|uniref:Uncharacterized protein n=1 Tax=Diplogelasinospora grovesii TaxID=303347 RepID=A0AAN6MXI8_9PEZI|nr:hypothetical protein QBC46DRAFT_426028 [Diplogelasinospora grovesii]
MASLNHARFLSELDRLVKSHPSEADLFLARSALMWLSVAQRPLRAHELWIALQVEESKDVEHIERLLTEPSYADEQKAVSSLQNLLGGLMSLTVDPIYPSRVCVTLCDPELLTFLNYLGELNVPETMLSLAFSTAQAHIVAASVCMVVCSVTPLHLSHVHDQNTASGLVLYAWAHWSTHFSLSGFSLANGNAAGLADSMIYSVSTDILVLLLSLNDFVTGPITFSAMEDRTRCTAMIKRTQEALARPIALLSAVIQYEGYSRTLQGARQIFEASKYSNAPNATKTNNNSTDTGSAIVPAGPATSKVQILRIDRLLGNTQSLFGEAERLLVQSFAETARSLRVLCVSLADSPLYDELLKEFGDDWSPLDILVNAGDWMEAVASYPYWQDLPASASLDPLAITDTADPNYHNAQLILSRLRKDGSSPRRSPPSPSTPGQSKTPPGISKGRWFAASAIHKISSLRARHESTFTVNKLRLLNQRTSSFASFPQEMQGSSDPLRYISPLIPDTLRHFWARRLSPLVSRVTNSGMFQSVDDFSSGAFTGGIQTNWPLIKSALLVYGYRTAFFHFLIAIIIHHIRGILLPWLGTYMWYTPMEDLRLALSNPDAFLESALDFPWTWFLFAYAQKYVFDIVAGVAIALMIAEGGRVPQATLDAIRDSPMNLVPWFEGFIAACKVGYVVWVLATIEYIFGRGVNTYSFLVALYRLLAGGDAEHIALGNILKEHWTKLPLVGWQLFYYVRHGFWPLLWGSLLCAVVGQPGLLLAMATTAGGVMVLIKYRSTFYIALEISGLFVVVGFLLVTLVLLGVEFVGDPLGLGNSTAALRKKGNLARGALPAGANGRIQILKKKAALPVYGGILSHVAANEGLLPVSFSFVVQSNVSVIAMVSLHVYTAS